MTIVVKGTLIDPVGQAMPGAKIRITSMANNTGSLKGTSAEVITDSSAQYSFILQTGIYQIEVNSLKGEYTICGLVEVDTATLSNNNLERLLEDNEYACKQLG